MTELSIITCTIPERAALLERLQMEIAKQSDRVPGAVEHVIVHGSGPVGQKISQGLQKSRGRYVSMVDDDDMVDEDYVKLILDEMRHDPDVITFGMQIPGSFVGWLRAGMDRDVSGVDRGEGAIETANHVCVWRRSIALAAPCVPRSYAWDAVWLRAIQIAFPNLRERHIHKVLYHYLYSPQNTRAQSPASIHESRRNTGTVIKLVRTPDGKMFAGRSRDRMWGAECVATDLSNVTLETLDEVIYR